MTSFFKELLKIKGIYPNKKLMNTNDMKGIEEAISYNEYIFGTNPSVYIFIHLTYCTVSSSQHSQVTTRILQKVNFMLRHQQNCLFHFCRLSHHWRNIYSSNITKCTVCVYCKSERTCQLQLTIML